MDLYETKSYGINEEDDYCGSFYIDDFDLLQERKEFFKTNKGTRIDIYIKEFSGNEPHIHLRDQQGNICRIRLRENSYQRDAYEKKNGHKLDKKEEDAFSKFMHSIVPGSEKTNNGKGITQWERLSLDWNTNWAGNNPGKVSGLVDINNGSPSYKNINEPK